MATLSRPPAPPPQLQASAHLREPESVPFDAPWGWLAAGWRDLWRIPCVSLTYGAAFALGGAALVIGLWSLDALSLFPAVAGACLLAGPAVAVGL